MTTPDWSFIRRRVWLVGHLVAVVAVVVFVLAGLWQLDRHDQRQALERELDERLTVPAVPLSSVVDRQPEEIRYRLVTVTGEFQPADEVMLVLQSRQGVSGHHVLTPLVIAPGRAVIVDRGWVPFELDQPGDARFAPVAGEVTVTGHVLMTQTRGRNVPAEGDLTQIGRVDLDRLARQMDLELAPVYVQLTERAASTGDLPLIAPLGVLDDAPPHLAYAVQWFLFAAVVVVGYGVLMRRTSRSASPGTSVTG